jgi:hypothetical protein
VGLSQGQSIVRHLAGAPSLARFEAGLPLRILVMISDPAHSDPAGQDRLVVGSERDDLLAALGADQRDGRIEIDFVSAATLPALEQALGERDYHVFHFIGSNGSPVGGEELAALLSGHRSLLLAVLSSVSGDGRDPGVAVAQALLRGGVPAVVSMRFELTRAAANAFAGSFYPAIAVGLAPDAAMAEARAAIRDAANLIEWATPVLHTGAPHRAKEGPAPVVDDDVQFTVYRPQALTPEQWATMVVFAHKTTPVEQPGRPPLDPVAQVEARARAHFDGSPPRPISGDSREGLPRGTQLRIVPDLPGIECNPEAAEVKWWEPVHEVSFRLRAGAGRAGSMVRGAVRVWSGPLILGEVSITIRVTAAGEQAPSSPPVGEQVQKYRKIFPSYSHRDRSLVEKFRYVVQAQGDRYLQDVLELRAGEQWEPRLLELIDEADMFQLFWSSNSMRSPHCRDEWEHALALRRDTFIRPVYWEDPLPADPAQELPPGRIRDLHFVRVPPDLSAPLGPAPPLSQPQPAPGPAHPAHPAPRRGRSRWLQAAAGLAGATAVLVVGLAYTLGGGTHTIGSGGPTPSHTGQTGPATTSPTSQPGSPGSLSYTQLRPGDCVTGEDLPLGAAGSWPEIVTSVPCDQGHLAEIIYAASFWPRDRAYPGNTKLFAQATVRCDRAFRAYVGIPRSQSRLAVTPIAPTPDGWDSGNRRLTCVAYRPGPRGIAGSAARMLFSSIRGSRR